MKHLTINIHSNDTQAHQKDLEVLADFIDQDFAEHGNKYNRPIFDPKVAVDITAQGNVDVDGIKPSTKQVIEAKTDLVITNKGEEFYEFEDAEVERVLCETGIGNGQGFSMENLKQLTYNDVKAMFKGNKKVKAFNEFKYVNIAFQNISLTGMEMFVDSSIEEVVLPDVATNIRADLFANSNLRVLDMNNCSSIHSGNYSMQNIPNLETLILRVPHTPSYGAYDRTKNSKLKKVILTSFNVLFKNTYDNTSASGNPIYTARRCYIGEPNNCKLLTELTPYAFPNDNLAQYDTLKVNILAGNEALKVVDLPNLKTLRNGALYACTNLKAINLENIEGEIGSALRNCSSLNLRKLPDSCTIIPNYGLLGIGSTSLDLNNITRLEYGNYNWEGAVSNTSKLVEVFMPKVTFVGQCAFANDNNLKRVYLPLVPPTLELHASYQTFPTTCTFYVPNQASLDAYLADAKWSTFGASRFAISQEWCDKGNDNDYWGEVLLDPEVHRVLNEHGVGGEKITKADLAAVKSIGQWFKGNTTLRHFKEFKYCTNIDSLMSDSFDGCSNLVSIRWTPNNLIPSNTFRNCSSLVDVDFDNGLNSVLYGMTFASCHNLVNVSLCRVEDIQARAFFYCINLREVKFPRLKTIGTDAVFNNCTSLQKMYLGADVPTNLASVPSQAKFIVPSNKIRDKYIASGIDESRVIADYDWHKEYNRISGYVCFWDAEMERVFVESGTITLNESGVISKEDANAVDTLPSFDSNKVIQDLSDLEFFPSITELPSGSTSRMSATKICLKWIRQIPNAVLFAVQSIQSNVLAYPSLVSVNFFNGCNKTKVYDIGDECTRIGNDVFHSITNGTLILRRKASIPKLGANCNYDGIKSVFVHHDLLDAYKSDEVFAPCADVIYPIGGKKWIEEFGSSDPYANLDDEQRGWYEELYPNLYKYWVAPED